MEYIIKGVEVMKNKTYCEECGTKLNLLIRTNFQGREICGKCERKLKENIQTEQITTSLISNERGEASIKILRTFGVVELIASIFIALIILVQLGSVDSYYRSELNPIGIVMSLVILIQGSLFYLFTSVICNIGEDVICIKSRLDINKDEKSMM